MLYKADVYKTDNRYFIILNIPVKNRKKWLAVELDLSIINGDEEFLKDSKEEAFLYAIGDDKIQ